MLMYVSQLIAVKQVVANRSTHYAWLDSVFIPLIRFVNIEDGQTHSTSPYTEVCNFFNLSEDLHVKDTGLVIENIQATKNYPQNNYNQKTLFVVTRAYHQAIKFSLPPNLNHTEYMLQIITRILG